MTNKKPESEKKSVTLHNYETGKQRKAKRHAKNLAKFAVRRPKLLEEIKFKRALKRVCLFFGVEEREKDTNYAPVSQQTADKSLEIVKSFLAVRPKYGCNLTKERLIDLREKIPSL